MKRSIEACLLAGLVLLLVAAPACAQAILYSVSSDPLDNSLRRLDPASGGTISFVTMIATGKTIVSGTGLATHPLTGQLFGLLTFEDSPGGLPALVIIDPQSGAVAIIGNTGRNFTGLAFTGAGTLYGVTGEGAGTPALYTVDIATAQSAQFQALGNGSDGEAIGFDPADGRLYHASGSGKRNVTRIFEAVNLQTHQVSSVPLSGFDPFGPLQDLASITALTYSQASFLAADLIGDFMNVDPTGLVTFLGFVDHTVGGLAFAAAPAQTTLVASVLPSSRAVEVRTPATAFATILNTGAVPAFQAGIALASAIGAVLTYNATDCATNAVIGGDNVPVSIAPGAAACFVISILPFEAFPPTEVNFAFAAVNAPSAAPLVGVNTLLMSASLAQGPDLVALAATLQGNGIVTIPSASNIGVFAVASVNVGAGGLVTVSANTGSAVLPVLIQICETDPVTLGCKEPPADHVTTQIGPNQTPAFGVFVFGGGAVPLDPAVNRVFVEFRTSGQVDGRTSVAIQSGP